jgi:competence protein ComEC
VDGPLRRYASPNDQSIVITVTGPTRSMLLAGDIETVAQAELGHLRADVLKVPHQGAATSDSEWLRGVGADIAVISVGPNDFGHPADWVIATLEESGAAVVRTDLAGHVSVPLG